MEFNLNNATEILKQTPATLTLMLEGLSQDWTESKDDKTNWAPYDVIGHLIYCEEADWIPRARIILGGDPTKTFASFDRFAQFELYRTQTMTELLKLFREKREESLKTLLDWQLTDEKLEMISNHPDLGRVTLGNLLSTWVVHDLSHIRQIVAYMARKYETNVGPWKQYLSILN